MSEIVFHKTAEEESNAASCQKKTQLLSSNFTSFHLSTVKMVFSWKTFCNFLTATDRIPVLGFDKKI